MYLGLKMYCLTVLENKWVPLQKSPLFAISNQLIWKTTKAVSWVLSFFDILHCSITLLFFDSYQVSKAIQCQYSGGDYFAEVLLWCDAKDPWDNVSECRTEFLELKVAAAAAIAATALGLPVLARATSAWSLFSWLIRESLLSSKLSIFFRYSEFSLCKISTFLSRASMYSFFFLRLSWAEIYKIWRNEKKKLVSKHS